MSESKASTPLVSVIVPYLRAESTIERALASVLAQTMSDLEIVTVGDGSTDGTRLRIEAMRRDDDRIRMVSFADNRGPSFARNRGIELARGAWVAVLDADDWYAPDRLQVLLDHAGDAPVVVDNLMGIDPVDGSEAGILFPQLPSTLTVEQIIAPRVAGSTYNFGYLKPLFRRAFLDLHGLRYVEHLRTAEDLLLLVECALLAGPIRTVDQAGYRYNLQFSPKTKRLAATSHSLPVDRVVAAALNDLLAARRATMTDAQRQAIEQRRDTLIRDADVSLFRHAVKEGRYGAAVSLLVASTRVRAYLSGTVIRKLGGRTAR
jgi:glycosyltransferase involved in cell wall biosynthesis